ncbi:SCN11A, partial [Symbiodinium necroappetens]
DLFSGFVVSIDLALACVDIDLRAGGAPAPTWAFLVCQVCLAFYVLELFWHVFVGRWQVLRTLDWWIDASIVIASIIEIAFLLMGSTAEEVRVFKLLRIARIMRLIRFIRKSPSLRELRKLMMMFASVIRTLAWSFLFCFIATTLWSMVAVELVNPVLQDLATEGEFDDCKECKDAFATILQSNLTFLQTMLAGDSWGKVAMPVIRRQPYTAAIFVGALVSVMYGILNLVVAVIVDAAMEQREKDITTLAADLDYELEEDLKHLGQMFKKVDANGDGELSLSELLQGAEKDAEFQNRLRVMDIDAVDLEQLFHMLDEDHSGSISPDEFTLALSRWMRESKTANHFVKYMVRNLSVNQRQMQKHIKSISKNLDKMAKSLSQAKDFEGSLGSDAYTSEASSMSGASDRSRRAKNSIAMEAPQRAGATLESGDGSSTASPCVTAGFDESIRELDALMANLRQQLEDVRSGFIASLGTGPRAQPQEESGPAEPMVVDVILPEPGKVSFCEDSLARR